MVFCCIVVLKGELKLKKQKRKWKTPKTNIQKRITLPLITLGDKHFFAVSLIPVKTLDLTSSDGHTKDYFGLGGFPIKNKK